MSKIKLSLPIGLSNQPSMMSKTMTPCPYLNMLDVMPEQEHCCSGHVKTLQ